MRLAGPVAAVMLVVCLSCPGLAQDGPTVDAWSVTVDPALGYGCFAHQNYQDNFRHWSQSSCPHRHHHDCKPRMVVLAAGTRVRVEACFWIGSAPRSTGYRCRHRWVDHALDDLYRYGCDRRIHGGASGSNLEQQVAPQANSTCKAARAHSCK